MSTTEISRLLRLMDEQQNNYERLHDLLAKKRAAIELNDLQALARAAQEIERLIGENNRVEEQRQTAAAEVARELGLRDRQATVSRLLRRLPEPAAAALAERRDRLTATLKELRTETHTIQSVLGLNVRLIDGLIRTMLSGGAPSAATYEANGAASEGRALRLLDRTA